MVVAWCVRRQIWSGVFSPFVSYLTAKLRGYLGLISKKSYLFLIFSNLRAYSICRSEHTAYGPLAKQCPLNGSVHSNSADINNMPQLLPRVRASDFFGRAQLTTHDQGDLTRLRSVPLPATDEQFELGQFIPLAYHFNMLGDDARMIAFKAAIQDTVTAGQVVLELGGGTGVLSFFAAQTAATVFCVERNPELVAQAQKILHANAVGERVTVVQADAFDYLPPVPVDVVICEMLHVGMLREKQLAVIQSFKTRYLQRFGPPLPRFIPEAYFQAVQPVQHSFEYHGYCAPTPVFQNPLAVHPRTRELGLPVIYQNQSYQDVFALDCTWRGLLSVSQTGSCNALRFITKNILTVVEAQQRTIDWHNQYLVVPLQNPVEFCRGQQVEVSFTYQAGDPIAALQPRIGSIYCSN